MNISQLDWIWRLRNMAFESGVLLEDWISAAIVSLGTECKNYRGISLLSIVGKKICRDLSRQLVK